MCALALLSAWIAVVLSSPQYPTVTINGDTTPDWLLHLPAQFPAPSLEQLDRRTIALTNTLIARVFTLEPEFATWDIQTPRGSALRAVSPEGEVTLDGVRYQIGGLLPLQDDGITLTLPPTSLTIIPEKMKMATLMQRASKKDFELEAEGRVRQRAVPLGSRSRSSSPTPVCGGRMPSCRSPGGQDHEGL